MVKFSCQNTEQLPFYKLPQMCVLFLTLTTIPPTTPRLQEVSLTSSLWSVTVPYWGRLAQKGSCPFLHTCTNRSVFFPLSAITVSLSALHTSLYYQLYARAQKTPKKPNTKNTQKRTPCRFPFALSLTRIKGTVLGFINSELLYEL